MGISKRALLEDYYLDELTVIIGEHNRMHSAGTDDSKENPAPVREVSAMEFFGM